MYCFAISPLGRSIPPTRTISHKLFAAKMLDEISLESFQGVCNPLGELYVSLCNKLPWGVGYLSRLIPMVCIKK